MVTVKQQIRSLRGIILVAAFLTLNYFDSASTECENGWIHYENSCYWFSADKHTWLNAKDKCRAHGGKLAEPRNKTENEYLQSIIKHMDLNSPWFWLGGRDGAIEGVWEWTSNGEIITYNYWRPGEPNGGIGENCIEFSADHWNDAICRLEKKYICQSGFR